MNGIERTQQPNVTVSTGCNIPINVKMFLKQHFDSFFISLFSAVLLSPFTHFVHQFATMPSFIPAFIPKKRMLPRKELITVHFLQVSSVLLVSNSPPQHSLHSLECEQF